VAPPHRGGMSDRATTLLAIFGVLFFAYLVVFLLIR
jgi:hypothetical protein